MSSEGNNLTDTEKLLRNSAQNSGNDHFQGEPMDVSEDEGSTSSSHEKNDEIAAKDLRSAIGSGQGIALSDLQNGYGQWGPPPLPPVQPSSSHTVLYKLPWRRGQPPKPYPATPYDRWDQDHVRMPNSSESLYPVQESDDEKGLRLRWELVQEALLSSILSSHQLESAILSYNSRYNEKWNFRALHTLLNEVLEKEEADIFFKEVLPGMISLALSLPQYVTGPIPLLKKHKCHTISLSQLQIASLLANAFFCTFPRRNSTKRGSEYAAYPDINFNRLFQSGDVGDSSTVLEKLKCILNYFRRICLSEPQGVITFARRYIPPGSFPHWAKSTKPLPKLHITSSGYIEDEGSGMLQVDFANKFVGGGVLGWGCVQEEIRFVICPELIVSRLFTECLDATEALIIVGCERYSSYSGYGHTFEWVGDFKDETPFDSAGRRHCSIVAMDALCFSNPSSQYTLPNLVREVNKAYVGFCETEDHDGNSLAPVATGNWGCGAFRGDAHLKALLQLMAAGEAGRALVYFTFGDQNLQDRIYRMYKFLTDKNVRVGKLWNLLCQYSRKRSVAPSSSVPDLYEFMYSALIDNTEDKCSSASSFQSSPKKPAISLKRKGLSENAKHNASSSHPKAGDSSDMTDSGLTAEDLDYLIEDFDSDAEQVEEMKEIEPKRKPEIPSNSGSCLALIEESLQGEKLGGKSDGSSKSKTQTRSASPMPLKKNEELSNCSTQNQSTSDSQETRSMSSPDQETVPRKESKTVPSSGKESSSFSDCQSSAVDKVSSSSLKKASAPKRKISDYFNPA